MRIADVGGLVTTLLSNAYADVVKQALHGVFYELYIVNIVARRRIYTAAFAHTLLISVKREVYSFCNAQA